eukprot:402876-Alexandrium_andersonii.AAC.1
MMIAHRGDDTRTKGNEPSNTTTRCQTVRANRSLAPTEVAPSAAVSWLGLLLKLRSWKGERSCALKTWQCTKFPH